jgi:tetratricopeptide (TPR) repeat protein
MATDKESAMRTKPEFPVLTLCALLSLPAVDAQTVWARDDDAAAQLLLNPALCLSPRSGPPPLLKQLLLAQTKSETRPFDPSLAPKTSPPTEPPPLFRDLGTLSMPVTTRSPQAQQYFDQGLRLSFAFNHAEARRAFQAAQQLDPDCAMCYWGEALVLGPNINAPMLPEANAPAVAAIRQAQAKAGQTSAKERALIAALSQRYSAEPLAIRTTLDAAYADAMADAAKRFSDDDTIQTLYAESIMDLSPWDYWEAGGAKSKGRAGEMVDALERVLQRNPTHPGAVHLYIHAVEASNNPQRALPYATRLAKLMPGAGHMVHMPGHIYYRVGRYYDALQANLDAVAADERYFERSPSDPFYRNAYYPHNLHFLMAAALMGGDGKTAIEAANKLDKVIDKDFVRMAGLMQPIKAAPYYSHAQFSDSKTILALPDPGDEFVLVKAMWHYARAVAFAADKEVGKAGEEIAAIEEIEDNADFKPLTDWQVPGREIVRTARLVATGREAAARGDLDAAATAYEEAAAIQDELAYTEPPYWYYPIRQSLGAVLLRAGRLSEAEQAFRDSLVKTPNNGWALYGLRQLYRQRGDRKAERAAADAMKRTWFGDRTKLSLARL